MPKLKTILFCGEKLLNTTVEKLYERFENIEIINSYGPTECTFAVTCIKITRDILKQEEIPIGIPKKDVNIFIIDEKEKKLKDGEIGEILITGESVAKGYVDPNERNFIMYNNQKAYKTGDLGYIKNGILYYKGRKDKQVKYKGYRIELDDIEQNLNKLEYVDRAIVSTAKNKLGNITKIIAFVKLKNRKEIEEIRQDLLTKIPEYMCPMIKIVEEIPLNKNGKCDERRLVEEY